MLDFGVSADQFVNAQNMSAPLSTAQGVRDVPFQRWFHFKEAFSPRFVLDAIEKTPIQVKSICDPFGGSGTTALTGQILGIRPITIEVNPFLADLIQSKLQSYNMELLISGWVSVVSAVNKMEVDLVTLYSAAPNTLYKTPDKNRWLFDDKVLYRISQYRLAIEKVDDPKYQCLLRVLLGSILISLSNVIISGKGRRYRKNWKSRHILSRDVDQLYEERVNKAIFDISKFSSRRCTHFQLLRGDSRTKMSDVKSSDLVLFSPPYPNTFDYTDIYNVELWVLGYLNSREDNRKLRQSTLRSHVQTKLENLEPPSSATLAETLARLNAVKDQMWNRQIPNMVGSYFGDIETILRESHRILSPGGMAVIVIGDSRYVNVRIDTAQITREVASGLGYKFSSESVIRVMKASAQQGWANELGETALYFTKN